MTKKQILAVDDEEDILELVQFNLIKEGYQVVCAASGNEAVNIAERVLNMAKQTPTDIKFDYNLMAEKNRVLAQEKSGFHGSTG